MPAHRGMLHARATAAAAPCASIRQPAISMSAAKMAISVSPVTRWVSLAPT